MLYEYFRFLTSKASSYARELGFLKESIAFEARAQRYWKLWDPHLHNCHQEVLRQTATITEPRNIWILGSGSLYETPWKPLLEQGFQLKLVDVFHPDRIKKIAQQHSGMELIEVDMTGFDQLNPVQKILLKVPRPPELPVGPKDFVISSNIWSQLPIMPIQFLSENTEINRDEKINWAKTVQIHHESWLKKMNCRGLLFSDFEIHHLNSRQKVLTIEQQPYRPTQFEFVRTWDWQWGPRHLRKVEAYSISPNTL